MIRSALKRGIKKVLGMPEREESPPNPPPAWKPDVVPVEAPIEAQAPVEPPKAQKEWVPDTTPVPGTKIEAVQGEIPVVSSEVTPPSPAVAPTEMAAEDDTAGSALSFAAVQEIMDEMVRPALQGDGGDITLIRIENNDVYVKLVGSCSTCPSSIMTMKMGVEALLKEEFPIMGSLIQVE